MFSKLKAKVKQYWPDKKQLGLIVARCLLTVALIFFAKFTLGVGAVTANAAVSMAV